MDTTQADWLCSPEGRALVQRARAVWPLPPLQRPRALAGQAAPALVRLALEQADLVERARAKTPHAERLVFTRDGLEQATAWEVALERASRWPLAPGERVVDLGAGLGLDALALASTGRPVLCVERDPVRARLLRHNVEALGLTDRVETLEADAVSGTCGAFPVAGAFLDPDRRPGGRRRRDATDFAPPVSTWSALLEPYAAAIVKAPPVAHESLPQDVPYEVVSLHGEVRERRLWWRGFPQAPPRAALALPSGRGIAGTGRAWPAPREPAAGRWLLDPDPAVTVAGLVGDLAQRDGLAPVHGDIAYLWADERVQASPGTWLLVDAVLPPDPPSLNAWLGDRGVGQLTLRSRGIADRVERWRARLRPRGPNAGTLVFTRGPDDRWLVLGALDAASEGLA